MLPVFGCPPWDQGTWQNYLGSNLISYAICRTLQNLAEPLHNYQLGHFDR